VKKNDPGNAIHSVHCKVDVVRVLTSLVLTCRLETRYWNLGFCLRLRPTGPLRGGYRR